MKLKLVLIPVLFYNKFMKQKNYKKTSYYKVITNNLLCYHNVITLLLLTYPTLSWGNDAIPDTLKLFHPVTQASLVYGQIQPNTDLFYNNTKIRTNDDGYFVLAIPQQTEDTLTLTTQHKQTTYDWTYNVQKRTWKQEVVNGLPPKKVSPSPKDLKRINQENQLLKNGRNTTFYKQLPMCFSRPVDKSARISSEFGSHRLLNGIKTAGHSGTDYALPTGSPVYAPADGIVKVTHPDMFYSGKTVLIDHGFGIFSSYSHLNTISVEQGETIKRGDKIGEIGTTGRSTGPHLHFTMTWFGIRIDPEYTLTHFSCDNDTKDKK